MYYRQILNNLTQSNDKQVPLFYPSILMKSQSGKSVPHQIKIPDYLM